MNALKQILVWPLSIFLFSSAVFPLAGLAQETIPVGNGASSQGSETIVIADVNIYNAKIASRQGHQLKISFQLSNGEKVQPDVRYSVYLTQKNKKGYQFEADRKVYPEIVNLGEGEDIDKTVQYTAPAYLNGEYTVWIEAANEVGMPYANAYLGTVKFQKKGEYIEINRDKCVLTVEKDKKGYSLSQGVDVKPEEKLFAHCALVNHFSEDKTVTPGLTTRLRSPFGKIIKKDNFQQILLKAKEEKDITLLIPKAPEPQAYDAVLTLREDNKIISNSITFHYVLTGESATIQNVRLDKPNYKKGEKAKIAFTWSGRADRFPEARYFKDEKSLKSPKVSIAVYGQDNKPCGGAFTAVLDTNPRSNFDETFTVPITKDCIGAKADVRIIGAENKVLSQREFQSPRQEVKRPQKVNRSLLIALALLLIIGIVIAFIVKYPKNKKGSQPPNSSGPANSSLKCLIFLVLLLGGILSFGMSVKADTFSVSYGTNLHITYNINLDKASYSPGETITVTGSTIKGDICLNQFDQSKLSAKNNGIGSSKTLSTMTTKLKTWETSSSGDCWRDTSACKTVRHKGRAPNCSGRDCFESTSYYTCDCNYGERYIDKAVSTPATFTAPTAPGDYYIKITSAVQGELCSWRRCWRYKSVDMPYKVVAPTPVAKIVADIKANNSDGPITIDYNSSANITWTSTNANSCKVVKNTIEIAIAKAYMQAVTEGSGSKSVSGIVDYAFDGCKKDTVWDNACQKQIYDNKGGKELFMESITGDSLSNSNIKDLLPEQDLKKVYTENYSKVKDIFGYMSTPGNGWFSSLPTAKKIFKDYIDSVKPKPADKCKDKTWDSECQACDSNTGSVSSLANGTGCANGKCWNGACDNTKPSGVISASPTSVANGNTTTITVSSIKDSGSPLSGVSSVEIWRKINNGTWEMKKKYSYAGGNITYSEFVNGTGNTYYYGFHIFDKAGNMGTESSLAEVKVIASKEEIKIAIAKAYIQAVTEGSGSKSVSGIVDYAKNGCNHLTVWDNVCQKQIYDNKGGKELFMESITGDSLSNSNIKDLLPEQDLKSVYTEYYKGVQSIFDYMSGTGNGWFSSLPTAKKIFKDYINFIKNKYAGDIENNKWKDNASGGWLTYLFEHTNFTKLEATFNWEQTPEKYNVGIYPSMMQFSFNPKGGGYIGPQLEIQNLGKKIIKKVVFSIWDMCNLEKDPNCFEHTAVPLSGNCNYFGGEGTGAACLLAVDDSSLWKKGEDYKVSVEKEKDVADGTIWKGVLENVNSGKKTLVGRIKLKDQPGYKGYGLLNSWTAGFFEYFSGNQNCLDMEYNKFVRKGIIGTTIDGKKWLPRKATYKYTKCLAMKRYSPKVGEIIDETGKGVMRSASDPLEGSLWELSNDKQINNENEVFGANNAINLLANVSSFLHRIFSTDIFGLTFRKQYLLAKSVPPDYYGWTGLSGKQSTGKLTNSAVYTLECESSSGTASDSVVVNTGGKETYTLSVSLSANPSSGNIPLTTKLTAVVSGTQVGTINYTFWKDCSNVCDSVESCKTACGDWDAKYDDQTDTSKSYNTVYSSFGAYAPKVVVERGTLTEMDTIEVSAVCSDTCASLGYDCGTHTICGKSVNCGSCKDEFKCVGGKCVGIPAADIKANGSDGPITVDFNTSVNISWTSENTTSCSIYANDVNTGWAEEQVQQGGSSIKGEHLTGSLVNTVIYTLDCVGSGGGIKDSVIVNVGYLSPQWKEISPF